MTRLPAALLLAAAIPTAFAGRPLTTEDASVLDDKRCQVEAWVDRSREATDAWFVPACNFGAGIEWQVGFARSHADGASHLSESYAQAKGLLKAIEDGSPWGVGWVLGVTRRPLQERHRGWENPYAIVPVSFALGDALVHVNAGWGRDRARRRDVTLWGAALEVPVGGRFTAVAEAFGENSEKPFLRAGGRLVIVKDVLEADLTVVARPGGTRAERFISLGVFWQSGAFLP